MRKQIHVNSYVKKDGTEVKEHYRIINTDNYGVLTTLPEDGDNVKIEERSSETLGEILNYSTITGASPVLQGGVSMDVGYPVTSGGGIGDIFGGIAQILGTVLATGFELTPLALQMLQAMNGGNIQASEYLKPQFDNKIKQLDTQVIQIKQNIDKIVPKLINAKNQTEYAKLYKPLLKEYQAYQVASKLLNKIKAHANNGNYQEVANEIENFTNENFNNIVLNSSNTSKVEIEVLKNKFSKFAELSSSNLKKMNNIANSSNGLLSFANNYMNYNRPEARQFMDFSLNLPNKVYDTSEYSLINPIFNQKLNDFLKLKGTTLQVSDNMQGFVFTKSSSISQKLSNFKQLQEDIKIKYNPNIDFIGDLGINSNTNLQYSVGHFTILNPRIENGCFKGTLFDIYDFDKLPINHFDNIKTYLLNNTAYYLQFLHKLKNYYFLIPIEFKW